MSAEANDVMATFSEKKMTWQCQTSPQSAMQLDYTEDKAAMRLDYTQDTPWLTWTVSHG